MFVNRAPGIDLHQCILFPVQLSVSTSIQCLTCPLTHPPLGLIVVRWGICRHLAISSVFLFVSSVSIVLSVNHCWQQWYASSSDSDDVVLMHHEDLQGALGRSPAQEEGSIVEDNVILWCQCSYVVVVSGYRITRWHRATALSAVWHHVHRRWHIRCTHTWFQASEGESVCG